MGQFIKHTSCDSCGSSDGNALYDNGSTYCFVCGAVTGDMPERREKPEKKVKRFTVKELHEMEQANVTEKAVIDKDEYDELKENTTTTPSRDTDELCRGIRDDIYTKFGVRHSISENKEVLAQYYPVTQEGSLVGLKVREMPKSFSSIGRNTSGCELFMQWKFARPGKYVLLTEGELDALAAYQMLFDYNAEKGGDFETAVVSPTVGVNCKKQIAANYKFFDRFDHIIVSFDNDDAGRKGVEEIVKFLPKGKVRIMTNRFKDANDYLVRGSQKQFINDFYDAQPYVPVGVLGSAKLYDRILEQAEIQKVSFPPFMNHLNAMLAGGMPLGHIINVAAKTGLGKCLGKGTPVLMSDFTVKNVEDIRDGDLVMGQDGTSRTVVGCTSGVSKLYRIDQVKGESYVVNADHILSLVASFEVKMMSWKSGDIVNINVEEYLALPITAKRSLKGYCASMKNYVGVAPENFDVDDAYILGLWLAEGTRTKSQFTLNNADSQLFDQLSAYCKKKNYSISIYPTNYRANCTSYSVIGGFVSKLKEWKVFDNKHIPNWIMNAPLDIKLNLIAGFVDGDGYVVDSSFQMTLKNDKLSDDVVTILRSVGLRVTERLSFKKCQNFAGDYYRVINVIGDCDIIPNRLTRKKAAPRKQIKNSARTGIIVTDIGEGEYFGFELEGKDKLFCLGDFTVTHNTSFVNELVYYWVFNSPHKIGIVSMELDSGQYGEVLLSRHISQKISLIADEEEKRKHLTSPNVKRKAEELFQDAQGNDRFYLLDNRDGSVQEIQDTVEELIVGCGCRIIVLDPLQDILDGLTIDEQAVFMKWAKGVIKSHNVTFIFINHMRKTQGDSHSVDEEDMQGSSTIIKSASVNIILSRDKESDDEIERNTTRVRVTKNRICGLTGPAGEVYYDNKTHTMHNKDEFFGG